MRGEPMATEDVTLTDLQSFKDKFHFQSKYAFRVGVEREFFLKDQTGQFVPRAVEILNSVGNGDFGYELSACQVESRIGPLQIEGVKAHLESSHQRLKEATDRADLTLGYYEVAPEDLPLDVYPDPAGRYQRIVTTMPRQVLSAACRVTGTHIHIGMPDHETALRVYNHVREYTEELIHLGDHSQGERIRLYRVVAPDADPPPFNSWFDLYACALKMGFAEEPRNCWFFIRISKHGTIEFRLFGATHDIDEIDLWAHRCHQLCLEGAAQ